MEERMTERIIYEEEEREIDLKQLFWTVLKRWRLILPVTILCGLIGVAYPFLRADQTAATVTSQNEDYEEQLEAYEESAAYYRSLIEEDRVLIEQQKEYQDFSILYQLDPMREPNSVAELFVRRQDTSLQPTEELPVADPEINYLLRFYAGRLNDIDYLTPLAEKFRTDEVYLRELISTKVDTESLYITLSACGTDRDMTDALLDAMLKRIRDGQKEAEAQFGEHELVLQYRSFFYQVNQDRLRGRASDISTVSGQLNRMISNQAALDKLVEPAKPAAPVDTTATTPRPSRNTLIKYGLIGLAGGLFLILFFLAIAEVLSNRVMSAGELNRRYHLRALTVLPSTEKKRKGALDRWLLRRGEDHIYAQMPEEDRLAMACANLSVYAPDAKDLVLVGQTGNADLDALAVRLSERLPDKNFHTAPCINENASSLETLKQYGHVILTEQIHASRYADIDREMQVLRNWNKTIVGSLVLEQ